MKVRIFILFVGMIFSTKLFSQSNTIGPGIALSLDGADANYVDLGDVYNTLNFPVTFEAWIYPTTYADPYSGIFATDSKNTGNYYGLYVRLTNVGKLTFEIGDGTGAGYTDRRGKTTSSIIPLNTWTHIAVVATSVTDIKFYFNGVIQSAVNTDGASTATNMVHNTNPAELGRYATMFDINNLEGRLDDARLWNTSRSEIDIRDNMCHKLTGAESGLIGYWQVDESYVSSTVNDLTTPAENGTVMGTVSKITSSAPIGDASTYQYVVDWSGVSLSLTSPGGDKLKINKIVNSPMGVQLYRVNSIPYYTGGLSNYTDYYYGVFTINGATNAKYTATYLYSMSNGVVTEANENDSKLSVKNNASILNWNDAAATLNTTSDKLTKKNITSMKEFIFNNTAPARLEVSKEIKSNIRIYPNPSDGIVNITNVATDDKLIIIDLTGNVIPCTFILSGNVWKVNLDGVPSGIYFVYSQNTASCLGKFLVQ